MADLHRFQKRYQSAITSLYYTKCAEIVDLDRIKNTTARKHAQNQNTIPRMATKRPRKGNRIKKEGK